MKSSLLQPGPPGAVEAENSLQVLLVSPSRGAFVQGPLSFPALWAGMRPVSRLLWQRLGRWKIFAEGSNAGSQACFCLSQPCSLRPQRIWGLDPAQTFSHCRVCCFLSAFRAVSSEGCSSRLGVLGTYAVTFVLLCAKRDMHSPEYCLCPQSPSFLPGCLLGILEEHLWVLNE